MLATWMSTRAGSPTDTIAGLTMRLTLSGGRRRCTVITATSNAMTMPTPSDVQLDQAEDAPDDEATRQRRQPPSSRAG